MTGDLERKSSFFITVSLGGEVLVIGKVPFEKRLPQSLGTPEAIDPPEHEVRKDSNQKIFQPPFFCWGGRVFQIPIPWVFLPVLTQPKHTIPKVVAVSWGPQAKPLVADIACRGTQAARCWSKKQGWRELLERYPPKFNKPSFLDVFVKLLNYHFLHKPSFVTVTAWGGTHHGIDGCTSPESGNPPSE